LSIVVPVFEFVEVAEVAEADIRAPIGDEFELAPEPEVEVIAPPAESLYVEGLLCAAPDDAPENVPEDAPEDAPEGEDTGFEKIDETVFGAASFSAGLLAS
jgi:hypothetical protein